MRVDGLVGGVEVSPWIEMVCLPLPALHPLDSERPFFSATTKGEGSDCAGTFTGPLCFQMVLFSCDTLDIQHLPRIRTLAWGSTEGRWVVCRHEERGGVKGNGGEVERDQRGGNLGAVGICFMGIGMQLRHHLSLPLPVFLSLKGSLP